MDEFLDMIKNDEKSLDSRFEMMDEMSKSSWVRSFQSIDTVSMASAHSLGKIADVDIKNKSRNEKMEQSKMSIISELTDLDGGLDISKKSLLSRTRKMEKARLNQSNKSNISMFSDVTDMTG